MIITLEALLLQGCGSLIRMRICIRPLKCDGISDPGRGLWIRLHAFWSQEDGAGAEEAGWALVEPSPQLGAALLSLAHSCQMGMWAHIRHTDFQRGREARFYVKGLVYLVMLAVCGDA